MSPQEPSARSLERNGPAAAGTLAQTRTPEHAARARQTRAILIAFATVYLFWGSTFLAIRYAVATIPPFLMVAVRHLVAGALLYPVARWRSHERPTRANWLAAALVGALLLVGGNGAVAWSEQVLPSGVAALLVATVPLWMVVVERLRRGGARPTGRVFFGIALGLTGVVFLVGPSRLAGSGRVDPVSAGVLIAGSICWATGSVFSRHLKLPESTLLSTAMFSLMGGAFLLVLAGFSGQLTSLDPGKISLLSILCVAYLVVFGSLAGFSAYTYLLDKVPPARVATYGYVNPVIAVFLGWAVAGEQLTARMLAAAAVIIGAVVLVISAPHAAPTESGTGQPVVPE